MSALAKFLVALKTAERGRAFVCPATGIRVSLHAPSYAMQAAARAAVERAWDGREVTNLNAAQFLDDVDRELLGLVASVDGELLGPETIGSLDERTFSAYVAELDALRKATGESLSDEEMAAALDELKKKPSALADTLSTFDSQKLQSLLRFTANQLWNLQTSSSSTPSP